MAAVWPATLPQMLRRSYGHEPPDNAVWTQTVSGRIKARRKSRKTTYPVQAQFVMSKAQLVTFETFWKDTIGAGTLPIQGIVDFNNTNRVWQPAGQYSVSATGPGPTFTVAIPLLRLPDAPV